MILGILQARVSSTRLPGKVLKLVQGKPLLELQIERLRRARRIDRLVVATSTEAADDPLEALCARLGVGCFRGSLGDVLDRFYQAAQDHHPEHIVRLTGDCPLADPELIDRLVTFYLDGDFDYASNTVEPTFPDGLDAEIFRASALAESWREAVLPSHREHVTQFILAQPARYRVGSFCDETDRSHLRWTVDEPADFEVIRAIYDALYPANPAFSTADILRLLDERPELATANVQHQRNEGLGKSKQDDARFLQRRRIEKSFALQERAKKRIPGLSQLLSKRPDMFSYGVWPGYFSRAKGAEVWDLDGNRYLDMSIAGIGANVLGYADPDVDAKVVEAVRQGTSSSLNCPEEVELAEVLCELHPWAEKARFARTGGESMAVAVRIARAATGRDVVAFCGYHGWHDWYLAANLGTENALGEHLIPGLSPNGVPRALAGTALPFTFNRLDELQAIVDQQGSRLAAIVLEPMRNFAPHEDFVRGVRALADRSGAVLILDEISAGFRMVTGGAHLRLGYEPDIAVFSKALGNGYPIAAVIGKGAVMDAAQATFISSTYWTERIGPTAALATIEKHRRCDVAPHLQKIGELVQAGWARLAEKHGLPIHVGGMPQLGHFRFDDPQAAALKAYYIQLMLEEGILASNLFYAMHAHTAEHVERYLAATDAAFARLAEAHAQKKLSDVLAGQPATAGFQRIN